MPTRNTMTVSITPELRSFVTGKLASGRYSNASEVVRAALRLLEQHEPDQPLASGKARNQSDTINS